MADFIIFDFWIALFGCITTSVVTIASFHSYSIGKRLRQSHFGFGFLLLSISLLIGALLNAQIQYPASSQILSKILPLQMVGGWLVVTSIVFLFAGLLTVYLTLERIRTQRTVFLLFLLLPLSLLVGQTIFPVIYVMVVVLIGNVLIHFYWNWKAQPNPTSLFMAVGFLCTLLAHASLMFAHLDSVFRTIYYAGNAAAIFFVFTGTIYLYVKSSIYKHLR